MPRPMRDRLLTAAQHLEDAGHTESAADVRAVVAPGGWTLLRASDPKEASGGTNLPLTINRGLRDQLKAKADEFGVTLAAVVADGFRKVLAGTWTPPQLVRTTAPEKVVLNVRVDGSLRAEINAQTAQLTETLGYRVTQSSIAVAWLAEELGVELATVDTKTPE